MRFRHVVGVFLCAGLAGCPRGGGDSRPSRVAPADGLAVAIYTGTEPTPEALQRALETGIPAVRESVALVDDRRTIELGADGVLQLNDVAEGIELASLIVEPLDGGAFTIKTCAREAGRGASFADHDATIVTNAGVTVDGRIRDTNSEDGTWIVEDAAGRAHFVRGIPDQITVHGAAAIEVRCDVDAAPGAHRVRLAYATRDLSWTSSYRVDVSVEADKATALIQPTFTIAGSGVIGARLATVSLLVGLPGGDVTPRLAWTGEVDLGPDEVSVQPVARSLPAELEYIYRGAVSHKDDNPRISYWRNTSINDVWFAIGISAEDAATASDLPAGEALFSVTKPDGTVRQATGKWPEPDTESGRGIDVRLWPSSELIGFRERKTPYDDGTRLVEQYLFSVANHSADPVVVWVEEEMRAGAAAREARKLWPTKPERRGDLLRFKVKVAAGKTERLGFEAEYRW